ncbi:MAG: dTDP-4-dehydrorhamnose 3,5-epimerase family protein [Candidatus Heimdallarchaeota archaeon]|nr:dTDP-4-dehydrorhamnose 3,5-epimerase family protein [Candidatus Heimdallarchaeota archaeon]
MKVEKTSLDNVLLAKPDIFEDFRGVYVEIFNDKLYKEHGIDVKFVQDDISVSSRDVLRGIHGDDKTWKLISCLKGKIYVVVVNCDKQSKNFGKWQSFDLSEDNRHQVLVPPKHGNAHVVLTDEAIFHYKQSTYYNPKVLKQFTYRFDDPRFNIRWPIKNPILSERDEVKDNKEV